MESFNTILNVLIAQEEAAPGGVMGLMGSPIVMFVLMFGIIYLMLIRPQQKQQKKHRELVEALKSGDKVITQSGIFGKIKAVDQTVVTLEIDHKVNIRVLKSQVQGLQPLEGAAANAVEAKTEDKK